MANKDRNKRSARQARARERAALEAAQQASAGSSSADGKAKKSSAVAKTQVRVEKAPTAKAGKPGLAARARNYFQEVRTEMHRVVWPSRTELTNYSVAVIVTLIVFGTAVWLVDTGFVALLVSFTGLRGA